MSSQKEFKGIFNEDPTEKSSSTSKVYSGIPKVRSSLRYASLKCSWEVDERISFRVVVFALLVVLSSSLMAAGDHSEIILFDIPRQQADLSLIRFAEQAGLTLIIPFDQVRGKMTNRLVGSYSIGEAIKVLLLGTGLEGRIDDEGQLSIATERHLGEEQVMNKERELSLLSRVALLVFGATVIQGVPAQDVATQTELEEVVVRGIRQSLEQSQEIKRDAENLVDAISATDIGKFPDENLAESLQRVTGVQITRSRGEGQSVTVRGLNPDFTRVQLNGRTASSASSLNIFDFTGGSRSFDFTSLSSDFVRTLEVHKTPTADMEEGGISATVNVRTIRPLDVGRRNISASLFGVYEDNPDDIDPRFSVLYTDVVGNDSFGITAGFSRSERSVDAHQYEAFGVEPANEGSPAAGPRIPLDFNQDGDTDDPLPGVGFNHAGNYGTNAGSRERINGLVSLQWKPSEIVELWFDGLYSDFDSSLQRAQNSHRFTNVNPARAGDPAGLVNAEISDGFVTLFDADAVDYRNNNRREDTKDESYNFSFGGNWMVTDRLSAEGELSYSTAERKFSALSLEVIGRASVAQQYENQGGIPSISYTRGYDGLDPNNFRALNLNGESGSKLEDENFDARLDFDFEVGGGFLSSIEFGGKYSDRDRERNRYDLFVSGQNLANLLNVQFDPDVEGGTFNAAPYTVEFSPSGFLGGADSAGSFPNHYVVSSSDLVLDQAPLSTIIRMYPLSPNLAANFNVKEEVFAGYLKANFEGMDGRLSGNLGGRVVHTEQTSAGYGADLNDLSFALGGSVTRANTTSAVSETRSYTEVLPSLNIRYEITDDLVGRLGLARAMSRPTLSQLSPASSSINLNVGQINQGNPGLKPFISDQVDVSLSWYFSAGGRLSAAYFYKDIDNIVVSGQLDPITVTATVVETGASRQFTLTPFAPVNGDSQKLNGFEISFEQAFTGMPFPLNGLGVMANYTYVDATGDTQLDSVSQDNYNITGYYEDERFSVRLAYNYRSDYQVGFINFFGDGANVQEFGQLDMSAQYRINDNFDLVFEALNLNQESVTTLNDAGINRGVEDVGTRLTFGLKANF